MQKYFERPAQELYDIEADPLEQKNLAESPDSQNLLNELRTRLERWMEDQGDNRTVFRTPYPASGPRPDAAAVGRD